MLKDTQELLSVGQQLWPNWAEAPRLFHDIQTATAALPYQPDSQTAARKQRMLGQLLLGEMAERRFEELYKETVPSAEFRLEDVRRGRSDTDYRLFNGYNRAVFVLPSQRTKSGRHCKIKITRGCHTCSSW